DFALRRQRRHGEHAIGALGVRHHFADDALGFRMRIENIDVDAGERKTRDPGPADDTAADAGRLVDLAHFGARFWSFSFSRTSAGPMMRAPMLSTTLTAFSTSCALVASWPLPT